MISNKRGDTQTLWMVVGLVVILLVSVTLIAGYSIGWGNFATWIRQDNIFSVDKQCMSYCSSSDKTSYCVKTVTFKSGSYDIDNAEFSKNLALAEQTFKESMNAETISAAENTYAKVYKWYSAANDWENRIYGNLTPAVNDLEGAEGKIVTLAQNYLTKQEYLKNNAVTTRVYSDEVIRQVDSASEAAIILAWATPGAKLEFDVTGKMTYFANPSTDFDNGKLKPASLMNSDATSDKITGYALPNKKVAISYQGYLKSMENFETNTEIAYNSFKVVMQKYINYLDYLKIKEGFTNKKLLGLINIKTGTVEDKYSCYELSKHPIWKTEFTSCGVTLCEEESLSSIIRQAKPLNSDTVA